MYKYLLLFLMILTLVSLAFSQSSDNKELRGVWLTKTASSIFNSKQTIAAAIDSLKKTGINAVFPGIFEHGFTLYPSKVMESITGYTVEPSLSGRDLLEEIIAEAHRVGIEVHPWFEFGFATGFGKPGPILDSYPDWGGRRLSTGDARDDDNFYWMSQANPEVQQFLISLALEVVDNYDVDGIMFDRIRYGNVKNSAGELITTDFGYDQEHLDRYRLEHGGQDPPAQPWDGPWMKWRSQLLNEFLSALYDSVKAHNPIMLVSNTPVVYPYGYTLFLQNWPQWVRDNSIDFIAPQVYRYDISAYIFELEKIIGQQIPAGYKRFYPGMLIRDGAYNAPPALAVNFINQNRRYRLEGGIFWYYEGIPSIASALRQQVFQQSAQMPLRTDNWRPEAVIVQEDDTLAQQTGNWTMANGTGTASYFSFDDKSITTSGSSGAKIIYQAEVGMPGFYDVYIYQLYGSQLANDVPIKLFFENNKIITVDETDNLNKGWIKVGTGYFEEGTHDILEVSTDGVSAQKIVAADGIMLILNRRLTGGTTSIGRYRSLAIPSKIELMNNYPNPFNSTTTISFMLPERQKIHLQIFDMLGRPIVTLASSVHESGMHQLIFDASNMSSGIYFCRLSSHNFIHTKKMILLR